ncbi:hydrogen gas-evolving membrane-bound hydrogenase subunit E [Falsiroseomonas sp.]|uniref:hydrogen gas-evolving membrane-bound hydrogenase subunit E n=1 Tax=Falsiroseomonas sp. TaxID=2870721 RepID=UPI00273236DD|nr:hydrogen gas-evolving membrane-bound hydrogenase subunit E [Falsiroseomonas sp.]MDP3416756.1 proton-conducting transporter membrane subunit [Falsiroseomonas sp.]
MLALPAIPLLALACVPLVGWGLRRAPVMAPWLAALPAALFLLVLTTPDGAMFSLPWIPTLGVELAFRLDGLSRLFALLIAGIGAGVFLYAAAYLEGHPLLHRFLAVLTLFMAAMLGAVLADDLLLLFAFWELTSLASFMLIGFDAHRAEARRAAQQGLMVTVAGGLAMLAGLLLLGDAAGTFRISAILAQGSTLAAHPAAPWIVVLIAIGCFAKSAQWPLHFWLPNAMVAPSPVSAYLHSATMVKLGVYLLARLNPAFEALALWQGLLIGVGTATMLAGAVLALRERDLKRKLAWSTVVALGTLVALIGIEDPLAATAAVVFLLVHALYKASLFLIAGIVDKKAGTRDAMQLRGLGRRMPITAAAALLAGLSMAGAPGFIGAFAKDLLFTVQLGVPRLLPAVALLVNAAMVVVAGVVAARPFMGKPMETGGVAKDPAVALLVAPIVLATLGLVFGMAPHLISAAIIEPAAGAILGRPTGIALGEKQGGTVVMTMSFAALGLGLLMFLGWRRLQPTLAGQTWLDTYGPDAGYGRAMRAVSAVAVALTRRVQGGSLRGYLAANLALVFAGAALVLVARGGLALPLPGPWAGPAQLALAAVILAGALAACRLRALFGQVMAAALVGFGVGILFLTLGAADLAFTQFTVEILAIVLLVAILARLPFHAPDARRAPERRRDALLAAGVGAAGTAILLAVLSVPFDPFITEWMGKAAVPEAKGRNVVNVIIVDFRALDTLGEIAVLLIAALAATVLLRRTGKPG